MLNSCKLSGTGLCAAQRLEVEVPFLTLGEAQDIIRHNKTINLNSHPPGTFSNSTLRTVR